MTEALRTWNVTLTSKRTTEPVTGRLYLTVRAATQQEAENLVRNSLPAFDWGEWVSAWGVTEVTEQDAA